MIEQQTDVIMEQLWYNRESDTYAYVGDYNLYVLESFDDDLQEYEVTEQGINDIEYRFVPIDFEESSEKAQSAFREFFDLD